MNYFIIYISYIHIYKIEWIILYLYSILLQIKIKSRKNQLNINRINQMKLIYIVINKITIIWPTSGRFGLKTSAMKRGHDIELNGIRKKEKWFLTFFGPFLTSKSKRFQKGGIIGVYLHQWNQAIKGILFIYMISFFERYSKSKEYYLSMKHP